MKKYSPSGYQPPEPEQRVTYDYAFSGYKCFADAECNESPSAGWQFVKYCMRG